MKVVTNNIENGGRIGVVCDHFRLGVGLGAHRKEPSSCRDPCVTEVLRRYSCREGEKYGRGNHQSHAEGVEVRPSGDNKDCYDGRHRCNGPASTPERRVPPCKHQAGADRSDEAQQETDLVQCTVPAHRWGPDRSTRREARPRVGGEEAGDDQSETGDADEQRAPCFAPTGLQC
jgi:hypothetical protein